MSGLVLASIFTATFVIVVNLSSGLITAESNLPEDKRKIGVKYYYAEPLVPTYLQGLEDKATPGIVNDKIAQISSLSRSFGRSLPLLLGSGEQYYPRDLRSQNFNGPDSGFLRLGKDGYQVKVFRNRENRRKPSLNADTYFLRFGR